MDDVAKLVALTLPQFAAVVALFLPGFVSLKVDRLIQPSTTTKAAEFIVDALAYSLLNAAAFGWAILWASDELARLPPNYPLIWALGILTCVVGPVIWPSVFRACQRFGAKRRWLLGPHRFAWDNFFSRNEPCWIIVHLKSATLVGGYFGEESYATVEPESGHIYLEELWRLDGNGAFVEPIAASKGALFRPSDYDWIEIFHDGPA
ncbi:MAG TPA: DUF6338 family protein [Phenylobacterium sp.]|uniref:DUF6338 family protein n=1 Tax=Phenylobacterium sp. TaxID=1871053 RepID=UPI002B48FEBF|nr:DUF6338 family protein [Phenylobacterium sp.]HKR88901.1 DUF6338 family protein [Phenylobacterium sp.]